LWNFTATKVVAYAVGIACSVAAACGAYPIVSGSVELTRWATVTITNKTAMFFFVLASVGAATGTVSYRMRSLPAKCLTLAVGYTLVFALGSVMSGSLPFRF